MSNDQTTFPNIWKRLERPISNNWTLVAFLSVFTLCLYRLFFKLNFKPAGDWQGASSVYGLLFESNLLPLSLLESNVLFVFYKLLFCLSLGCWFYFSNFRTISIFAVFLSFTLACSHHLENIPRASSHTGNILSLALFVFFLAHIWSLKGIKDTNLKDFAKERTTTYLIPFALKSMIFLIYSISGFYKLSRAGFSWIDSSNIQTYLHYFASSHQQNGLVAMGLESPGLASLLGVIVLILECLAFVGIFHEVLGMLVGALFIAFHLSITYYFGWTFFSHVVLLVLVASPLSLIWLNPNRSLSGTELETPPFSTDRN